MHELILKEGVTLPEYAQILRDIEGPFRVVETAKKGDSAVDKGQMTEGEEYTYIPLPTTPSEAWERMLNIEAKKAFVALQYDFLRAGLKYSSTKAVGDEIEKIENFIQEAGRYRVREAFNWHKANHGQYQNDFRYLEYLRISEGFYKKYNCFEGNNYFLTATIYAECFLWLPFLKNIGKKSLSSKTILECLSGDVKCKEGEAEKLTNRELCLCYNYLKDAKKIDDGVENSNQYGNSFRSSKKQHSKAYISLIKRKDQKYSPPTESELNRVLKALTCFPDIKKAIENDLDKLQ